MKIAIVLSVMILAAIGHAANAAPFDASNYSGFEVISARPRTAPVKPFVMAIFTQEQQQRLAIAASKKSVLATKDTKLLRP